MTERVFDLGLGRTDLCSEIGDVPLTVEEIPHLGRQAVEVGDASGTGVVNDQLCIDAAREEIVTSWQGALHIHGRIR